MTADPPRGRSVGFWLSLGAAFLSSILLSCIATAWLVERAAAKSTRLSQRQTRAILWFANLLPNLRQAYLEVTTPLPHDMLFERAVSEKPYWIRRFPAAEDSGYLLFSGIDPSGQSLVKLLRIADGEAMAQWHPDWQAIAHRIGSQQRVMLAMHPLLLDDGDIVFNVTEALVRQSPCNGAPIWVLNEPIHHSVEPDGEGNLWVPAVAHDEFTDSPWLRQNLRDDALARVSLDGKILQKYSFARILRENHLQAMLLGTSGRRFNDDPIHLNQIKAAPSDGIDWQRGDLLISARHLSTVFLYRPATGKILWYQQGPWLNQHSVDFVDDHRISIFDNHILAWAPASQPFPTRAGINHMFVYDFRTHREHEPFAGLLERARPATVTEGRGRILPDGGLFIEETNFGRHLRFSQTALLWSRVNDYDGEYIGAVAWSRYLTAEEAKTPLAALVSRRCTPKRLASH